MINFNLKCQSLKSECNFIVALMRLVGKTIDQHVLLYRIRICVRSERARKGDGRKTAARLMRQQREPRHRMSAVPGSGWPRGSGGGETAQGRREVRGLGTASSAIVRRAEPDAGADLGNHESPVPSRG